MFSFVETRLFSRLVQEYLTDSIPGHILRQIREELEDEW